MKGARDASTALFRGLRANFPGLQTSLKEIRSRSWTSATFAGACHALVIRIEGEGAHEAANRFLACLDAAEFNLIGHVLAEIAFVAEERRDGEQAATLSLEALTVEWD